MMSRSDRFDGQVLDEYEFVVKVKQSSVANSASNPKQANRSHVERRTRRWHEIRNGRSVQAFTGAQLKSLCRKGVPRGERVETWLTVTRSSRDSRQQIDIASEAGKNLCRADFKGVIYEDLRRTFPDNKTFQRSNEISDTSKRSDNSKLSQNLKNVLEVFAARHPDPGYCQGEVKFTFFYELPVACCN